MAKLTRDVTKRDGVGILNAYGDMWSPTLFDSEEDAHRHVADFWRGVKLDSPFKYTVVRARQYTRIRPIKEPRP